MKTLNEDIKTGNFKPVYLLYGEEAYLKKQYRDRITKAIFPDGDTVNISARSIGKANVQVILEPLGGGGNAATAGAQMKHTTVKDALDQLMASIDRFYEK